MKHTLPTLYQPAPTRSSLSGSRLPPPSPRHGTYGWNTLLLCELSATVYSYPSPFFLSGRHETVPRQRPQECHGASVRHSGGTRGTRNKSHCASCRFHDTCGTPTLFFACLCFRTVLLCACVCALTKTSQLYICGAGGGGPWYLRQAHRRSAVHRCGAVLLLVPVSPR